MQNGQHAARELVKFMIRTYTHLSPAKLIATYKKGHNEADRIHKLWDAHGQATLDNMAACCTFLASLRESAWTVANDESNFAPADIREMDYDDDLRPTYRPQSFFPSVALRDMKQYCT